MGKETQLWDDSALMNAFDEAMNKYKAMHRTRYQGDPAEEEKLVPSTDDNGAATATMNDDTGNMEQKNNSNIASDCTKQTCISCNSRGEATELLPTQENSLGAELCDSEHYVHSSIGPSTQETSENHKNLQSTEYNKLLNQYYELEEQRQKVLLQLNQVSNGNYQNHEISGFGSASNVPWNACYSTSQTHQDLSYRASCTGPYSTCCPYSCTCFSVPWTSVPCCGLGGQYRSTSGNPAIPVPPTEMVNSSSLSDDNIVKTAMGAAQKAMSSMKAKTSSSSSCEENQKGNESAGILECQPSKALCQETDLTVVLNAWYSAGFYTGKYLMEQSTMKRQP